MATNMHTNLEGVYILISEWSISDSKIKLKKILIYARSLESDPIWSNFIVSPSLNGSWTRGEQRVDGMDHADMATHIRPAYWTAQNTATHIYPACHKRARAVYCRPQLMAATACRGREVGRWLWLGTWMFKRNCSTCTPTHCNTCVKNTHTAVLDHVVWCVTVFQSFENFTRIKEMEHRNKWY